jgi:hypothetical protein
MMLLMYTKLPMYLFFYMPVGLNDFDGGKSISRAIGRVLRQNVASHNVNVTKRNCY